jgi:signal transduction histidine kinase
VSEKAAPPPVPSDDADDVMAIVAHEIRAPLTVIAGYLEILGRTLDEASRERALTESLRAVGRIETLVDDLAHVTSAGEWFDPKSVASVSMSSLAAEVAASFGDVSTHVIEVESDSPGTVSGNESRLRQALTNLVANAVVHAPAGGRITLAVSTREDAVVISVEDEGPGIPADARERIFERFERLGTGSTGQPGTGLGLYIVREIVRAHGGSVRAEEGECGRGTRMVVELPAGP